MTDLQKRFAEEYVIDYHITNAGKRAGIKGDNVNITAWKMLQLEDVQAYVEKLQAEAAERSSISKDKWVAEWEKIGFSNIQNYMDDNLDAKRLSEVNNPQAIKSIKKTVTESEFGTKVAVEFSLHDKVAGLNAIGKHFGWFEKDNEQSLPKIPTNIQLNIVQPPSLPASSEKEINV